jgi:hypothetical protein
LKRGIADEKILVDGGESFKGWSKKKTFSMTEIYDRSNNEKRENDN